MKGLANPYCGRCGYLHGICGGVCATCSACGRAEGKHWVGCGEPAPLKEVVEAPPPETAAQYVRRWSQVNAVHIHVCAVATEWLDVEYNGVEITISDYMVADGRAATALYDLVYGKRRAFVPTTEPRAV